MNARYVFLGNNVLAERVLRWLVARGDRPAGLVVHPRDRARRRDEVIAASDLDPIDVLEAHQLDHDEGIAWLRQRKADLLVSVLFGHVLRARALAVPRRGAVNLHTALLPFNRGAFPNVWSIVDGTPAGVTLHWVDAGIDTGDVIAQKEVEVRATDTGETLYRKLEDAAFSLFTESWPVVAADLAPRVPQPTGGTFHRVKDVETIDRIEPDDLVRAGHLIDVLRARTFPPHRGAYLHIQGRRVYLRLALEEGEDGS